MSFLDGFAVDNNNRLSFLERLINNQFLFARASGTLDHDEGIGSLHEPSSNLFDVSFSVIPDGIEPCIFGPLLSYLQDVIGPICLRCKPFVDLIISDMEGMRNVCFDEERPYPELRLR